MPAVSIIVCTYNRAELLRRALESVLSQTGPDAEILVIDDGSDVPVALPSYVAGQIRVVRTAHGGPGAARRAGLDAARGGLVAYCDDDDEWMPNHLSLLRDYLDAHSEVALVFGDEEVVHDDHTPAIERELPEPPFGEVSRIFSTNVLHRAAAARDVGGFDPGLRAYEDRDLWFRMHEAHIIRHLPTIVSVIHRHGGCVSEVDHPDDRARLASFMRRSRVCREHESDLAPRRTPFDPTTWQDDRRELDWQSPFNPRRSFGAVARQLLPAVERAGIQVRLRQPPDKQTPELAPHYYGLDGRGRVEFKYEYWHLTTPSDAERLVLYTMRESTLVHRARINHINQTASLLYVPCRENVTIFRDRGVTIPIKVLPHGVDPERFPFLSRQRTGEELFTFGTFGDLSPRKGIDVLIRAFREEFAPGEPVRLLMKGLRASDQYRVDDPRVELVSGYLSFDALLGLLEQMDVFALPSRGEGFGLCGLEAMATGLPLIATNWSGPADYIDPSDGYPLGYTLVNTNAADSNGVRYFGEWAEPDVEHLRHLLRWTYEHREEAVNRGRLSSRRVLRDWTWDHAARQLRADLDALACGLTPI